MGKKDDASKKKVKKDIWLIEGTALKNVDEKEGKNKTPVWIKNTHLKYEQELKKLQIELMKLQLHMKGSRERILAIFEGRDAAGNGGTIKRFIAQNQDRSLALAPAPANGRKVAVIGAGPVGCIVAAFLAAPIAAGLFGGVTGSGADFVIAAFRQAGAHAVMVATGEHGGTRRRAGSTGRCTTPCAARSTRSAPGRRAPRRRPTYQGSPPMGPSPGRDDEKLESAGSGPLVPAELRLPHLYALMSLQFGLGSFLIHEGEAAGVPFRAE